MLVYVLNKNGEPLMPCSPAKARKLLKENKAKIVKRDIFTIQLLYGSSGYKQPTSLGIDAGSKTIGVSATTEIKEVFAAEYTLRNDISGLIADRKMYRTSRRCRKTRYRKARLLNRLSAKYSNVNNTFGYITKADRLRLGLDKSHNNDAFCSSEILGATKSNFIHKIKKVRCQNRQIHKALFSKGGKRKVNQSPYIVHGFRLFDKVKYDGKEWFIAARRLSGYFMIKSIDFRLSHQNIQYKKLQLVHHRGSLIITK